MLWFFDRDDEALRLETRYDNESAEFVAIVNYPDGQIHEKRFGNIDAFRLWLEMFERNLALQHWTGRSGPLLLPYGWPNKRLT